MKDLILLEVDHIPVCEQEQITTLAEDQEQPAGIVLHCDIFILLSMVCVVVAPAGSRLLYPIKLVTIFWKI